MIHLSFEYKFSTAPVAKAFENSLLDLLAALHAKGSIAGAAEQLNRSYRYVWGRLKEWEETLGASLVIWGRNSHGAELTPQALEFLRAMQASEKELEKSISEIKTALLKNAQLLQKAPKALDISFQE
jgi:putative molybdopterin biosynthesis protein